MNNLYNQSDVLGILSRIEQLSSNSQRQWGKMNVEQMLSHLNAFLETALDLNSPKRIFPHCLCEFEDSCSIRLRIPKTSD